MQIEIKKTTDWSSGEWDSYTQSFCSVFGKEFTTDFFRQKYLTTITGFSLHALLEEENRVVGACTVIPVEYIAGESIQRFGLMVDVFILEAFRSDIFNLLRMYEALKPAITGIEISLVMAVPNDLAKDYWAKIAKWKTVGMLKYYALPVRAGNVLSKLPPVLNTLSRCWSGFAVACAGGIRYSEKPAPVRLHRVAGVTEKQRYNASHKIINEGDLHFTYGVVNEEGIMTTYLIDFFNRENGRRDGNSLRQAVRHILATEKTDLITFIGRLSFFQVLLFRVPYRFEPRHLPLMVDIIRPEMFPDEQFILNPANWDFGLFNFDVR